MDDFDETLDAAGQRLQALADGPAREAAETIERRFAEAGSRIEAALSRAASSGQLDFERMAEAILRDLAQIAAESLFASRATTSPTVNLNLSGGQSADPRGLVASQGAISAALARAVSSGSRFL
ncbi:MAG: phage tail tape measure C-terminal domain-containing protein [Pseudomonadota bacterium]